MPTTSVASLQPILAPTGLSQLVPQSAIGLNPDLLPGAPHLTPHSAPAPAVTTSTLFISMPQPSACQTVSACFPAQSPFYPILQSLPVNAPSSVSFEVSSLCKPTERYRVPSVFTARRLSLTELTYSVAALQQRYQHPRSLPLSPLDHVRPLLLIGSN